MDSNDQLNTTTKKKGSKYLLYIAIVLLATAISLTISLWGCFDEVVDSFRGADPLYLLIIALVVVASYFVDALIIMIFCRLYTRRYKLHQGLAASMVGQFYSDVTPGASGGQIMQVYTLKSQGVQVSNAASIMVMWFILYQSVLIGFDLVAFGVEFQEIMTIENINITLGNWSLTIPMVPFIIVGFVVNAFVIVLLVAMSYSHHFHNFILHHVIGFLGKIRVLRNPDKTRENLRVQVENFKIELRRLQANIPVVILQVLLFAILIFLRNCVPYFAGLALHAWNDPTGATKVTFSFKGLCDVAFLSAFHQMVTGLIPLPGAAGVSEYFYSILFHNFFYGNKSIISATQILWRFSTFHIPLLVSGIVSALYRSRPKETIHYANRQTYLDLQLATYEERKRSADTMYETSQLSRQAIQQKMRKKKPNPKPIEEDYDEDISLGFVSEKKKAPAKSKKPSKKEKKQEEDWGSMDL